MVTERSSESRMRFRTSRGTPEWSGGEDRYIGRRVLESGIVLGVPGDDQRDRKVFRRPRQALGGLIGQGEGAHQRAQPLSGLMCPLPLAHKAPQRLSGPPKPLSDTLVITWYPRNNSGLQYLSSNILIFTSGPFWSSSSCPGSHLGHRTTFGHQHT